MKQELKCSQNICSAEVGANASSWLNLGHPKCNRYIKIDIEATRLDFTCVAFLCARGPCARTLCPDPDGHLLPALRRKFPYKSIRIYRYLMVCCCNSFLTSPRTNRYFSADEVD